MALRVGGVILCGGESQRMGRPKAWLPWAGEPMLLHIVRILEQVVDTLVVVAAPSQEVPLLPAGVQLARDRIKGLGPLQGLCVGLAWLKGQTDVDAAYVTSCDVPFLRPAFIECLIGLLGDNSICVPRVQERFYPLAAVYRLDVLDAARRLLQENQLRLTYLFDTVPTRIALPDELTPADPELGSLENLNAPEEYEAARQRWDRESK
jgi:molybdopterin-guanine dinucleotide biosynthesis protein A